MYLKMRTLKEDSGLYKSHTTYALFISFFSYIINIIVLDMLSFVHLLGGYALLCSGLKVQCSDFVLRDHTW